MSGSILGSSSLLGSGGLSTNMLVDDDSGESPTSQLTGFSEIILGALCIALVMITMAYSAATELLQKDSSTMTAVDTQDAETIEDESLALDSYAPIEAYVDPETGTVYIQSTE